MGAMELALATVEDAIQTLNRTHFGTYQYYMAVAHRSHVRADLGHKALARRDYEEVAYAQLREATDFARNLRVVLEARDVFVNEPPVAASSLPVPPTWQKRVTGEVEAEEVLTELEDRLIGLLAAGPKTKDELIEALYGNKGDYLIFENRLKQHLHRLRRKRSDLVGRQAGKYVLIDRAHVGRVQSIAQHP